MSLPFGPELIGQTEKNLNALLARVLDGRLTEPEWVTLRLALRLSEDVADHDASQVLAAEVAARTRFDAPAVVAGLGARGLLRDGRPTAEARDLVGEVRTAIEAATAPLWRGLPADDVDAAARVLNEVLERTRAQLRPAATAQASSR